MPVLEVDRGRLDYVPRFPDVEPKVVAQDDGVDVDFVLGLGRARSRYLRVPPQPPSLLRPHLFPLLFWGYPREW
jgi:hypothetical protein